MDGYIKKQDALEAVFKARRLVDARDRIDCLQPDEDVVKGGQVQQMLKHG